MAMPNACVAVCVYGELAVFFDDVLVYRLRGSVYLKDILIKGNEH